jgi:hypothetical protein
MKKLSNDIWMHILSYLSPYIVRLYIDRLIKINKDLIYNIELNQDTYIGLTNKKILIENFNLKIEIINYFCNIDDKKKSIYSLKKNKYSLAKTIFYWGFKDEKYYDLKNIRTLLLFNKYSIEEAYLELMIFNKENEELVKKGYLPENFNDYYDVDELNFDEPYDQSITSELQIFINKINIYRIRTKTIKYYSHLLKKLDKYN